MTGPQKRSISIAGHRTSISLEPVFWALLQEAADEHGLSLAALVRQIDEQRDTNLSSAIRTWLVTRLRENQERAPATDVLRAPDP